MECTPGSLLIVSPIVVSERLIKSSFLNTDAGLVCSTRLCWNGSAEMISSVKPSLVLSSANAKDE